ncbi:MAG TPA: shikimate kinase, partial [Rhabdochlamydiaceae bacterium]
SEIYRTRGEAEFRRLEEEVVLSLFPSRSIIALGGGTPLNPRLIPHLHQLGRLVTLIPDLEVLKERFRTLKKAAYLETMTFEEMVELRQPLYEKLAAHQVILVGKTEQEILKELGAIAPSL